MEIQKLMIVLSKSLIPAILKARYSLQDTLVTLDTLANQFIS